MKKIFIIAGETSGDILAADIIKALKQKDPTIVIQGIGGPQSRSAGLTESLFPMADLSLMGIVEIVPKIPQMLSRINQTVAAIAKLNPDVVLSIDCPDFSFRVQKKVKAKRLNIKQVHYVAPTVWAWRAGRAKKIAKFLDGVLCLFPFEPPYFEKVGLSALYTGHPVIARYEKAPLPLEARTALGYTNADNVVGVLLGSRRGELTKHGDIFLQVAKRMLENKNVRILVPTLPHIYDDVISLVRKHLGVDDRVLVVSNPDLQTTYFRAMDSALAVSGTVGLELAVAGVPHVIGYKTHPLTAKIIKKVIKVKYAHLANIILDKEIVPECIQEDCSIEKISSELVNINKNIQKSGFDGVIKRMKTEKTPAETIVQYLNNGF